MQSLPVMAPDEIITLLGKNWMTHDGMWFYHCFKNFGIDAANNLNKAAMSTLAPIEMQRFLKAFQMEKEALKNEIALKEFLEKVAVFLIPRFMNVEFDFSIANEIHWKFNEKQCFAYNGISMLGVIDQYECGPMFRICRWLDSLGIHYRMEPEIKYCLMPSNGECKGVIKIIP